MSFKFDWNIQPAEDDAESGSSSSTVHLGDGSNSANPSAPSTSSSSAAATPKPAEHIVSGLEKDVAELKVSSKDGTDPHDTAFEEISHHDLLSYLPPAVTYSQIDVNLTADGKNTGQIVSLLRRDLFDARFQLANEEDDSDDEGSAYANMIPRSSDLARGLGVGYFQNSDSDLIKGVYEGGLKTWEASLDLIDCLCQQGYGPDGKSIRGKRILEIGCGTAMPTIYLLEALFHELMAAEEGGAATSPTVIHLQDYNPEVVFYITFANVVLCFWKAKTLADKQNIKKGKRAEGKARDEETPREKPIFQKHNGSHEVSEISSPAENNELEITAELVESFVDFLDQHQIELKFFCGPWHAWKLSEEGYDIVVTSETVYEPESLPSLCQVLTTAAKGGKDAVPPPASAEGDSNITLVACKRVYFGVGGGEHAFKECIAEKGASVREVWRSGKGVDRTVLKVTW